MKRLILIWSTLLFSILFIFFKPEGHIGFLLSDQVLSIQTWLYFFFEHLVLILLAIVILDLEPKYRFAAIVFLCIQIIDTIDYMLTYGERWNKYLPSWNLIKCAVYGGTVIYYAITRTDDGD